MDAVTLAYMAGLFDGEGCVSLHVSRKGSLDCHLTISNGHRGVLELCQYLFGGSIRQKCNAAARPVFDWQISGPSSERFARAILPFTVVKSSQLQVYVDARETLLGRPLTATRRDEREAVVRRLAGARA